MQFVVFSFSFFFSFPRVERRENAVYLYIFGYFIDKARSSTEKNKKNEILFNKSTLLDRSIKKDKKERRKEPVFTIQQFWII